MHDPMTVAHEIKWPFGGWRDKSGHVYRPTLLTIWHVDPEKDGSDDSCDWFGGRKLTDAQKVTRDKIVAAYEHEWNRSAPYERFGWFMPKGNFSRGGEPNYSTHALVLAMFRIAANEHFGHWSGRANRFLSRHLFNILHFAENSCDSLCTDIEQKHGARDGKVRDQAHRLASCIYGWILRAERPWYKHPRWHVWHWKIQVPALQSFRRWLLSRCHYCGKGFRWNESVVGLGWNGPLPRWFEAFRGEREICHSDCAHKAYAATAKQSAENN